MKRYSVLLIAFLTLTACNADETPERSQKSKDQGKSTDAKPGVLELDGLKSPVPENWRSETPSTNMRMAQYRIPKADGDTEDGLVVVSTFGKGGGGPIEDNMKRWKGEMMPDKDSPKEPKIETYKVGDVKVTVLDQSGVFQSKIAPMNPNSKTERKSGYRMFAAVFESPNGPYFIKATGPAKTMEQNKKGFDEWLKNFK